MKRRDPGNEVELFVYLFVMLVRFCCFLLLHYPSVVRIKYNPDNFKLCHDMLAKVSPIFKATLSRMNLI